MGSGADPGGIVPSIPRGGEAEADDGSTVIDWKQTMTHCCCRRRTAMAMEGAMCGVNNREGGQRRAWYYHFVDNLYRMVVLGKFGDGTDQFRF